MSGVSTSIQLNDRITPVLQSITASMNAMMNSFSAVQSATDSAMDLSAFTVAQQEIANASASLIRYQEELEKVRGTPVKTPEPVSLPAPSWKGISGPEIFNGSGAARFEEELQSADRMMQQLYKSQQAISSQARGLKVTPPGMLNDVAAVENRMQMLGTRIQELNQIPVNLRTDRVNNEIESLRGKISQASEVQESLNQAMSRMDISAANSAYQKLNTIMDSTEVDIRNNLTAQEQFNDSVRSGQGAANGLEGTIKRYAAALLSVATAGKAFSIADEVSQTKARLDLMNYGLDTTEQLQQKIFESAQRSRGAYQSTADAVSRLGMQARGAFRSNDELIAFAEQMNKTFVIAGTSAQGVDSVMLQLTQSMASGKLQGEELNAVLDNAQPIVQNIADYMGVPVGKIKKMASEGVITAEVIKNAMFAAADRTNAKFEQMPKTFGQVANDIKNQALMAFQPALEKLSSITQTEGFNALVSGVTSAIQVLALGAAEALDLLGKAALWVQDNWSWLAPVIGGVAIAVGLYTAALGMNSIAQGINNALKSAAALKSAILATSQAYAAGATFTEMVAVQGLNAALLACPITWIVLLIIGLVAALYAGVAAINHFKGTSISATGIIAGAFGVLAAHVCNGFIYMWNSVAMFVNFIGNVFNDPVAAVQMLFLQMAETVIGYIANMAHAIEKVINSIPGVEVSITAGLDNFQSKIKSAAEKVKSESEWKEYVKTKDFIDYSKAAEKGYAAGAGAENKVKDLFSGGVDQYVEDPASRAALENISGSAADAAGNAGNTAGNTAAIADAMDIMDEDLKYMRDAAEQEIINRFTLAELKVDMTNNNTLKTETDFDRISGLLAEVTGQLLATAAEGGHL